jgi:hypothetical protein
MSRYLVKSLEGSTYRDKSDGPHKMSSLWIMDIISKVEGWTLTMWNLMCISWRQLIELRTKVSRTSRNRKHGRRSRRPRYLKSGVKKMACKKLRLIKLKKNWCIKDHNIRTWLGTIKVILKDYGSSHKAQDHNLRRWTWPQGVEVS